MPLGAIVAPAVPAVGIGAMASVGLLAIACALVLLGLRQSYSWTLGALLTKLADKTRGIRWIGGTIADSLESIDEFVLDQIGKGILASEKAAARFFHAAQWLWEATVDSIREVAAATADALDGIQSSEIPRQITERTRETTRQIDKTNAYTRARDRALSRQIGTGIDRLQRDLQAEKLARQRGIDALEAKLEGRIDGIVDGVQGSIAGVRSWADARIRGLGGRLSSVQSQVAEGAVAAVALGVLARNFPWYRCSNVRRFNSALCRGNPDLLMALAALTAVTAVAVDPRVVARTGQQAVELLEGVLEDLADVVR